MSANVELAFLLTGDTLPVDHGYALYGALSRVLPEVHTDALPVAVGSVHGSPTGNGKLRIGECSRLRIRAPASLIGALLPLAGKALDVDGCRLRIGVPSVYPLVPAPLLSAAMVTIKNAVEPDAFLAAVRADLVALDIKGRPELPIIEDKTSPHAGKPRRRVLRIKDNVIVGYALRVGGLTAEESLLLQERGLGGRRKMGCGWFTPVREDEK